MRARAFSVAMLLLGNAAGACEENRPSQPSQTAGMRAPDVPAAGDMGTAGAAAGSGAAVAGQHAEDCDETSDASVLGIASAPLNAAPPLNLQENVQLLGEGLEIALMPPQNVAAGLRWRGGGMFLIADPGFLEIPVGGAARWNPASSVIVWGIRAGDFDRDGDHDILVLTMAPSSAPPGPFESRLTAWERTPDGLIERAQVMRTPEMRIGMPYAIGDLDGDGDLDVVGFAHGVPEGFIQGEAFEFSPVTLANADAAPELAQKSALLLDLADRNQDGAPDLLILAGNTVSSQLENSMFVMLGDGAGKFGPAGPLTMGRTPLVPHGPDGAGTGMADVTGDGLVDVLAQGAESTDSKPILHLYVSTSATTLAPAIELDALGFELADVDDDGNTDIVTTQRGRLSVLLSRGDGAFEPRDLGVPVAASRVKNFTVDPGPGSAPATVYMFYHLDDCRACANACSGRCLFGTCVECLSDADCAIGRCEAEACTP
jgi:hypothetical protein